MSGDYTRESTLTFSSLFPNSSELTGCTGITVELVRNTDPWALSRPNKSDLCWEASHTELEDLSYL